MTPLFCSFANRHVHNENSSLAKHGNAYKFVLVMRTLKMELAEFSPVGI